VCLLQILHSADNRGKLLSATLEPSTSSPISNYTKCRCDYFECQEEFSSKHLLESHLRSQHNASYAASIESEPYDAYAKKDLSDSKMNEVLFVPQMELQVLEFNNPYIPGDNRNDSHNMSHLEKSNGFKKLSPCDFCGKYFNKHYLESHKRSHTGAKPFKCSVDGCNHTFTQSSSRNFHVKRFHRVNKYVFKCSYLNCEMSFDRLEEMQKHLQQHQALLNTLAHTIEISGIKLESQDSTPNVSLSKGKTNHVKSRRTEGGHKHVCVHCGE